MVHKTEILPCITGQQLEVGGTHLFAGSKYCHFGIPGKWYYITSARRQHTPEYVDRGHTFGEYDCNGIDVYIRRVGSRLQPGGLWYPNMNDPIPNTITNFNSSYTMEKLAGNSLRVQRSMYSSIAGEAFNPIWLRLTQWYKEGHAYTWMDTIGPSFEVDSDNRIVVDRGY
jgi:hypothetical protein